MIRLDRLALDCLHDREAGQAGQQFGQHARGVRVEVHHHHEGDAGPRRHGREELLQGGHSPGGGPEAHNCGQDFAGRVGCHGLRS